MNLIERDLRVSWHPFTQHLNAPPSLAVLRGEGALLFDAEGRPYIDAISSWWVNLHGHAHPVIAERVAAQLRTLEHVLFAGCTHPAAVELAERLLRVLPGGQRRVFFSDDGSTAVEVALKMAVQAAANRGKERTHFVALQGAYHGDTFGAMSAGERGMFIRPFAPLLFPVTHIVAPTPGQEQASLEQLRTAVQGRPVAAFIFEPLIQGVGGMRMYQPEALDPLLRLCRSHGVLTIADEVMTGFGRTGPVFASNLLREEPDIICLSKGLTGGTTPLAVTATTEAVYEAFLSEEPGRFFLHGHSFTANAVGCAAALASLDLLLTEDCAGARHRIEATHAEELRRLSSNSRVEAPRVRGTVAALDVRSDAPTSYVNPLRDWLYRFFLDRGVLLRPLGNIVYVMPPYCITDEQLRQVYGVIREALDALPSAGL